MNIQKHSVPTLFTLHNPVSPSNWFGPKAGERIWRYGRGAKKNKIKQKILYCKAS